nr:RecName: Full=Conotoxin Bu21; Flags: Precursor [Conus bullatus]
DGANAEATDNKPGVFERDEKKCCWNRACTRLVPCSK